MVAATKAMAAALESMSIPAVMGLVPGADADHELDANAETVLLFSHGHAN